LSDIADIEASGSQRPLKPWLPRIEKDADSGIAEIEDAKKRLAGVKSK